MFKTPVRPLGRSTIIIFYNHIGYRDIRNVNMIMMGLNLVSIEQDTERGNPVGDDRKSSKTK